MSKVDPHWPLLHLSLDPDWPLLHLSLGPMHQGRLVPLGFHSASKASCIRLHDNVYLKATVFHVRLHEQQQYKSTINQLLNSTSNALCSATHFKTLTYAHWCLPVLCAHETAKPLAELHVQMLVGPDVELQPTSPYTTGEPQESQLAA